MAMKQKSIFHYGDIVAKEYEIKRKIGEGQFSEVYEVYQASKQARFALKIDRKRDVRTVKRELEHLHRLKYCSQVCNVHGSGTENGRFFIVMDLLGANLAETMRRDFGGHMPVETIKLVAASLLNAVEQLHTAGYVHRDVKPANFALHSPAASVSNGTWVTIDFGLARRYVDENGIVMPERQDASFRGSTTYASVFAHDDKDLGRRDDLWSWFYILVEMLEGTLPWRTDRDSLPDRGGPISVSERKRDCMAHPDQLFSSGKFPKAVCDINAYLQTLHFADLPDYARLHELISTLHKGDDGGSVESTAGPKELSSDFETRTAEPEAREQDALMVEVPIMVDQQTLEPGTAKLIDPPVTNAGPESSAAALEGVDTCLKRPNRDDQRLKSSSCHKRPRPEYSKPLEKRDVVIVDAQQKYLDVLKFIATLSAGGALSQEGMIAASQLRAIQPTEAVGIACMIIDELADVAGSQRNLLIPLLEDLSAFAAMMASRLKDAR